MRKDTVYEMLKNNPGMEELFQEMNYLNSSPEIINEINKAKEQLDNFHLRKLKKLTTKEQGDLLENYILGMIKTIKIFDVISNKRTSGNEIDIIIRLTSTGLKLKALRIIPEWIEEYIIIECKNYSEPVGITYINKFHSLMTITKTKLGFFITYKGITGKDKAGWQDSQGLIKKINLMNYANSENPIIIDANNEDFKLFHSKKEYDFICWIKDLHFKLKYELELEDILNHSCIHENAKDIVSQLKNYKV